MSDENKNELDEILDEFLETDDTENEAEAWGEAEENGYDYEEEDRKSRNKTLVKAAIAVCAVLVAAVLGFVGFRIYDNISHGYFMTVDGQRISAEEYKFFHTLGVDEDWIIEMYLDMRVLELARERYNLTLDASEVFQLETLVESALASFEEDDDAPDIGYERLFELFTMLYGLWYEKVIDKFFEEADITDSFEYAQFLAETKLQVELYIEESLEQIEMQTLHYQEYFGHDYVNATFKFIDAETEEDALNAISSIVMSGISFDNAAVLHSSAFDMNTGEALTVEFDVLVQIFEFDFMKELMELNEGEISEPIYLGPDSYIVLQMVNKQILTKAEIIEMMMETAPSEEDIAAWSEAAFLEREVGTNFELWLTEERGKIEFSINQKAIDRVTEEFAR
jgi:hypothetical protein